jgi:hypothetical protein
MGDTLKSGEWLLPGQSLQSSNRFHTLVMQGDGNFVLYSLGRAVWASSTPKNDGVTLQGDGNLVIYASGRKPVWDSGTAGRGDSRLVLQDDRNAVIYDNQNRPTWSSGTNTDLHLFETRQVEISPKLMEALKQDASVSPIIAVGLQCTTTGPGVWVCVGALIAIAVILEFINGHPAFGPNNDLRIAGGQISDATKQAGKQFSDAAKHAGDVISDIIKW